MAIRKHEKKSENELSVQRRQTTERKNKIGGVVSDEGRR